MLKPAADALVPAVPPALKLSMGVLVAIDVVLMPTVEVVATVEAGVKGVPKLKPLGVTDVDDGNEVVEVVPDGGANEGNLRPPLEPMLNVVFVVIVVEAGMESPNEKLLVLAGVGVVVVAPGAEKLNPV